jgi:uncharacterized membrane protein YqjE
LPPEPTGSPKEITAAIQEISERAQVIVREEIELAKTEITIKLTKLAKGAAIGGAAAVFIMGALLLALHGLAWLAYWVLPVSSGAYFWGFFLVAAVLFVLGILAGLIAARFFKSGSPPKPDLAIEEAQRIRETVSR